MLEKASPCLNQIVITMILNYLVSNSVKGERMKIVQPIRSLKQIKQMKEYLKAQNLRNYMLFLFGIHSGLRISDLLALKIEDVCKKDYIVLKEKKTKKAKAFPLSKELQEEIAIYLAGQTTGWLFPSRHKGRSLSRKMAYHILSTSAKKVGIKESIGTHTLRKTFGYWAYKQKVSLELIQKILNHSSPYITLQYIGITQDQIDNVYQKIKF